MTDQHRDDCALAVLDRLLDDLPVRSVPSSVTAPPSRSGRGRTAAVVALAAAVAVVVGLGVGVLRDGGTTGDGADVAGPPPGWRVVGIGQVTVQVPDSWSLAASDCGSSNAPIVYFPGGYQPDCAVSRRSSLYLEAESPIRRRDVAATADGEVEGHAVVVGGIACAEPRGVRCSAVIGVPDLDAWFTVTALERDGGTALATTIRSTLDVLPDDQTTVPAPFPLSESPAAYARRVARAGLRADVQMKVCPATANCFGYTAQPAAGSVVGLGEIVTITRY